ncbi:MAG: YqaE/Pmp3 family membrane protein [Opitutales bacterium]|nr:YqaE/Pmp3 family membrane protein [Opitutales bacterium]
MSILTIILCILIPPVAVLLKKGLGVDFIINLILTLIFWLPGVIHGFWVCSKK